MLSYFETRRDRQWAKKVLFLSFRVFASQYNRHMALTDDRTDSPTLHLVLLLFSLQTALTTAVCVAEYNSWPELTAEEKNALAGLYVPYLVFGESLFFCVAHRPYRWYGGIFLLMKRMV